jgi:signal transduction histidine kinase
LKPKIITIRYKLIGAFFASAAMAGLCMLILCVIMIIASVSKPFAIFFFKHFLAFCLVFLAIFTILMIGFFLLLIRKKVQYLEEIIETIEVVSKGNLGINIPIRGCDEFGELAATVNSMAYQLKLLIEEERGWERTKNDLITNVSHDLRTPLTSILGYLELIAGIKYTDEDSLRHYAHIALSKSQELKTLIDDLFEFSKLSNPGIKINKIRVSIGELLEQVILGFIPVLKEARMEYRLFFPDEKLMVNGDPVLLTRVFDNLINNAITYGSEGKYLDVELTKENDEIVIHIINYGKPIPDSDLPYIFERFYRAERPRLGRDSGSGLGLAIVKNIIELHNGSIKASRESSDNKTIFEVRLKNDTTEMKENVKKAYLPESI